MDRGSGFWFRLFLGRRSRDCCCNVGLAGFSSWSILALIAVLLRLHVSKGIFESLVCSVKREDSLEVTSLGSGVVEGMNPSFCVKEAAHGIA